jgi:hypothetical protein
MKKSAAMFLWLMAISLCSGEPAAGQLWTGEIRLQVLDPSGAGLEAAGTLQSFSTGVHRSFQTDSGGFHAFEALPFGPYRLEVVRPGFSPQSLLTEVRSETPTDLTVTLKLAPVETTLEVREPGTLNSETLTDPRSTGAAQYIGADTLNYRRSSMPSRSVIDLVNAEPGWLLEANGVLHPRGSEYGVQYVIDGVPLYDNRSPAFAQSLGVEEFDSMIVRTADFPAEFGRKLGGVIEVNTGRDQRPGLHGSLSLQGGSFGQYSSFASLQYSRGRNSLGASGEGFMTDRYLDPPVVENYTNRASGGGFSVRFERDWSPADTTRFYVHSRRTGFLVPNEQLQQAAGQRQDRTAAETLGQVSHTHLLSPRVLLQARAMVRDTSAALWSNPLSTPILPGQDRGFRQGYLGASVSYSRAAHEFTAGADALFTSIHEAFSNRIVAYQLDGAQILDPRLPPSFQFHRSAGGSDQSAFLQDRWRLGQFTVSAGLRFDHDRLVTDETAWSPRLGAAYSIPSAGLVLRASYNRVFEMPAVENILLASTNLIPSLGANGAFLPLQPSRGNYFEAGFAKNLFSHMRLEGTWYRRSLTNFADDNLLLNTGISFPLAFRAAEIHGYEAKLEVPHWGLFSGFLSYTNMAGRGQLPVAGGLFLGDGAVQLVRGTGNFPVTQDQRNTLRARVRFQVHPRLWFAFGGGYNSGLPFEIEGPTDAVFLTKQYGPAILGKVNFERGRVRPSATLDSSVGLELLRNDPVKLRLQGDVFNLADRLNVINFAGVLSGTALEAGRSFAIRVNLGF